MTHTDTSEASETATNTDRDEARERLQHALVELTKMFVPMRDRVREALIPPSLEPEAPQPKPITFGELEALEVALTEAVRGIASCAAYMGESFDDLCGVYELVDNVSQHDMSAIDTLVDIAKQAGE